MAVGPQGRPASILRAQPRLECPARHPVHLAACHLPPTLLNFRHLLLASQNILSPDCQAAENCICLSRVTASLPLHRPFSHQGLPLDMRDSPDSNSLYIRTTRGGV